VKLRAIQIKTTVNDEHIFCWKVLCKMTVVESAKNTIGLTDGSTPASRQAMSDARLSLAYRDSCAHLLIPLNRCRQEEYYLPWKCETERHTYEKCQYEEFKKRVAKMDELRAAKGGERSN
jgi:NADH dehydrogenase (ubiquinone) 1 beta subcomplex subunit 7